MPIARCNKIRIGEQSDDTARGAVIQSENQANTFLRNQQANNGEKVLCGLLHPHQRACRTRVVEQVRSSNANSEKPISRAKDPDIIAFQSQRTDGT